MARLNSTQLPGTSNSTHTSAYAEPTMDVHLQTEKQAFDLFQDGWMLSDLLKHLSRELRRRQAYLDPIDLASRYEELEYGFCYREQ